MFKEIPANKASIGHRTLTQGHGINNASYKIVYMCKGKKLTCIYYSTWASILQRCYNRKFHQKRPTYIGCTIDPNWLLFSTFRLWMETQNYLGKVIDKNILIPGNKHYGPDTCIFTTKAINNLLCLRSNYRGQYPLGVSRTVLNGNEYYVASCSFYGKQKRLGYFKTPKEAANIYSKKKSEYILKLSKQTSNLKLKKALKMWTKLV